MANNYINFSFDIALTPEANEWAKRILNAGKDAWGEDLEDEEAAEVFPDWDDAGQELGFDFSFEEFDGRPLLIIYDNDGEANTEGVVTFVRAYLKKFEPKGMVGFEVAATCSKHRPGEFGGSAHIVTADDVFDFSTADWLLATMNKMRAKK